MSRRRVIGGMAAGSAGLAAAALGMPGEAASAPEEPASPLAASQDAALRPVFRLTLDFNNFSGMFASVSGLSSESEIVEYVSGSEPVQVVHKLPGRLKYGDITLKRGVTSDLTLWEWRALIEQGDVESARSDGAVSLLDARGAEVARWNFERGWPAKVSLPAPRETTEQPGIAVEELVIVVERVERVR